MWCIMNRAQFNLLDDEAIARDYSPVFFFFSLSLCHRSWQHYSRKPQNLFNGLGWRATYLLASWFFPSGIFFPPFRPYISPLAISRDAARLHTVDWGSPSFLKKKPKKKRCEFASPWNSSNHLKVDCLRTLPYSFGNHWNTMKAICPVLTPGFGSIALRRWQRNAERSSIAL